MFLCLCFSFKCMIVSASSAAALRNGSVLLAITPTHQKPQIVDLQFKIIKYSLLDFKDVVDTLREVVFFTQILIPFVILVYCTVRIVNRLRKSEEKTIGDRTKLRRAVFLVTAVMVVFSFCFLPCTIARMFLLIVRVENLGMKIQITAEQVFDGLMVLSYMDCLLDPLVYCFCSTKFKALYLTNYLPFLVKSGAVQLDSSTGNTQPPRNKVI